MSEYQFYEFQTLDRALSESDMAYLRTLSSRVVLSSTSATFAYNWSDFRGDAAQVLAKYFDAMLYIANWGSRRLMFRFPRTVVDAKALQPYCVPDSIKVTATADPVVLDIFINKDKSEWLEEENHWLSRMTPLRGAIVRGDYRCLYLVWLRACALELPTGLTDRHAGLGAYDEDNDWESDDEDDGSPYSGLRLSTPEPPVPPNLKNLNNPLRAFVEFFEIDGFLIDAAAEASPSVADASEPIAQWINALSETEAKQLLLRVASGEPNMDVQIVKQLRARFGGKSALAAAGKPRTVGQIFAAAKALTDRTTNEVRRKAEAERARRLDALAKRELVVWDQVIGLIKQKKTTAYDEAVKLLRELRELAQYHDQLEAFRAKVLDLQTKFSSLSGLKSRITHARLLD